jgi:hypothetical protein
MIALDRGVKILLAATALALLSGCVAVVSGGRPHHGWAQHHFYDDRPGWRHATPWHWRHRHFHGPRHHSPWFHHRRHRR